MDRSSGVHRQARADFKAEKFRILARHGRTSVNPGAPMGLRRTGFFLIGFAGVLINVIRPVCSFFDRTLLGALPSVISVGKARCFVNALPGKQGIQFLDQLGVHGGNVVSLGRVGLQVVELSVMRVLSACRFGGSLLVVGTRFGGLGVRTRTNQLVATPNNGRLATRLVNQKITNSLISLPVNAGARETPLKPRGTG